MSFIKLLNLEDAKFSVTRSPKVVLTLPTELVGLNVLLTQKVSLITSNHMVLLYKRFSAEIR